jgi:hypothetical protein
VFPFRAGSSLSSSATTSVRSYSESTATSITSRATRCCLSRSSGLQGSFRLPSRASDPAARFSSQGSLLTG